MQQWGKERNVKDRANHFGGREICRDRVSYSSAPKKTRKGRGGVDEVKRDGEKRTTPRERAKKKRVLGHAGGDATAILKSKEKSWGEGGWSSGTGINQKGRKEPSRLSR